MLRVPFFKTVICDTVIFQFSIFCSAIGRLQGKNFHSSIYKAFQRPQQFVGQMFTETGESHAGASFPLESDAKVSRILVS